MNILVKNYLTWSDFYLNLLKLGCDSNELSPRNPVLHNLLKKCEQIAGEAQSRQLVEMLSSSNVINSNKSNRPKSQQSTGTKPVKVKQSKSKSGSSKAPRYSEKSIFNN